MKEQAIRGYYDLNLSKWDLDNGIIKKYSVGMYFMNGGTEGEFMINIKDLGKVTAAKLEVFDDGCAALLQFIDLVTVMAERSEMYNNTTPNDLETIFAACNIVKLK